MNKEILIGDYLKKKREKQGLELKDIAQKTKINLNILKTLESNAIEQLPNKTYVKGFVQNYAKAIGADENEARKILDHFYQDSLTEEIDNNEDPHEVVEEGHVISNQVQQEIQEKLVEFFHKYANRKNLLILLSIVILAFVLKGITKFFQDISREQVKVTPVAKKDSSLLNQQIKSKDKNIFELEQSKKIREQVQPVKQEVTKQVIETSAPGKLAPAKEEKVANSPESNKVIIINNDSESDDQKIALPNGKKFPYENFSPAPLKTFEVVKNAPESKDENLLPERIRQSIIEGKENVFVNATKEDTWISFQVDDAKIKRFVLKKGRSILLKGEKVLLFLGNVNAATIFYNNELINTTSRTGVKSLIFPSELGEKLELPLFPSFKGVPYPADFYKENMLTEKETKETQED